MEERNIIFNNNKDFSNPLSIMARTMRQKINEEKDHLTNTIN